MKYTKAYIHLLVITRFNYVQHITPCFSLIHVFITVMMWEKFNISFPFSHYSAGPKEDVVWTVMSVFFQTFFINVVVSQVDFSSYQQVILLAFIYVYVTGTLWWSRVTLYVLSVFLTPPHHDISQAREII